MSTRSSRTSRRRPWTKSHSRPPAEPFCGEVVAGGEEPRRGTSRRAAAGGSMGRVVVAGVEEVGNKRPEPAVALLLRLRSRRSSIIASSSDPALPGRRSLRHPSGRRMATRHQPRREAAAAAAAVAAAVAGRCRRPVRAGDGPSAEWGRFGRSAPKLHGALGLERFAPLGEPPPSC